MSNTLSQIPIVSPTLIPGCQLWLDAADPNGNGTVPANGATVSTWVDKSGNARNMTATGTVSYSTYGGIGSILLNNTYMRVNSAVNLTNLTVFAVSRCQTAKNNQICLAGIPQTGFEYNSPDGFGMFIDSDVTYQRDRFYGSAQANVVTNSNPSGTDAYPLREMCWTNTSAGVLSSWYNGNTGNTNSSGVSRTSTATGFNLGFSIDTSMTNCVSQFSELIVYNAVLTTTQRQQIEGYLTWKWGLQANLPTGHPYKNQAPINSTTLPSQFRNLGTIPLGPSTSAFSFFNPNQISGCQLWLDAADSSKISLSGSSITSWTDKSVNGYSGTSTVGRNLTYATSVLNGLNCAQTTTGQTLIVSNVTLGPYVSAFILCNPINQSTGTPFLEHGPDVNTNYGFFLHTQNNSQISINNTSGLVYTGLYPNYTVANTWQMLALVNQDPNASNQMSFYLDASLKFSLTTVTGGNVTQSLYLNGRNNTNTLSYPSYIAEVIIYNRGISNSERQRIEGYLAWKWGLQASLPAAHPYKNTPPGLTIPVVPQNRQLGNRVFQPTNFSGCQLWFDAADTSTITGTNPVTNWTNKGLLGGSATQYLSQVCTSGTTVNGLNYVRCPAGNEMRFTAALNTQARSWFFVSRQITTLSSGVFASLLNQTGNSGQDSIVIAYTDATNNNIYIGGAGVAITVNANVPAASMNNTVYTASIINSTTASLNALTFNGASQSLIASVAASGFNTTSLAYSIGKASYNTTIDVMELIFYYGDVTTNQRQVVEGYLAWKWGLVSNLPTTHPYKKFPPPPG